MILSDRNAPGASPLPAVAPLTRCAQALARGETSSESLVRAALARASDAGGEGSRVFTRLYSEAAPALARAADLARAHQVVPSALAGIPVSIKDLFDVRGEPTPAGSRLLATAPPCAADSTVVARLRAAGAVLVGRTNMTEFAFSAIGLNPHYGTPLNPFERARTFEQGARRARGRVPGGSSSGCAVSVTDAMAVVSIGTDTGGSVRVPAALCGIAGFKPTARRVPRDGVFPLSTTLDSVGPLAPTAACCALADAVLAGEAPIGLEPRGLRGARLGVVRDVLTEGLDPAVAVAFDRALQALAGAGATLSDVAFPELRRLPEINRHGGFPGSEALALHRDRLARARELFDQRVASRILLAEAISAADYVDLVRERAEMIRVFEERAAPFDALLAPTVAVLAPPMVEVDGDDEAFRRVNTLILRNPLTVNFVDGCALTLPCHRAGDAPVGLMIIGAAMADRAILRLGLSIEQALASARA
jgi:aspartyl-tRNA(Asn)/glutamyl-tRNA(Gln) amidotransferase subunit A